MLKTILKSVREFKKASILTPLFMVGEVAMETLIPMIMAMLIDDLSGDSLTPILESGALLIVTAMASLFFGTMSARQAAKASTGFAKNLRKDMYYKIQNYAFTDIDFFSSSSLVTRMTTDVTNIQNAYGMIIRMAVRTPLMLIFAVIMSMTINMEMSLIFLAIIPFLGVALFFISKTAMPIFRRIFKRYDALNDSVQENVSGIRVVKSFVREDYEKKKFGTAAENVRKDFTSVEKLLALNTPIMNFFIYVAMLLVSFFGAEIIISSQSTLLTTGQLSSLINYGMQILGAMMMLSFVFVMITMSMESMARITEVLNRDSSLTSPENGIKEVKDGSIEFSDVTFRYNEKSKRPALSDIDLTIKSGQTVGIIGGTGSSKSTLIQLISRLYDVSEGSIKVGGVDVRDYDLVTLRDAVSVVLQKNVLFAGTIKDNLRWGDLNATDEEVIHAAVLAQADEFVQQLPEKYDTMITQGGTNVSGGQKQRLCIARALLKKPKILILDDSTSAVDTRTDALIRKAFRQEIPDTTKIIIAQRVASVEDADMILVMEGGKIIEKGTSDELRALGGTYAELYDTQTKGADSDEKTA